MINNKIIIISGDPNSINSELIYKCWKKLDLDTKKKIFLVSNYDLIKKQFKRLKYKIKLLKVDNLKDVKNHNLKIINVKLNFKNPFNVSYKNASKFIKNSLELGHKLALDKNVNGIINCAIDKKLLGRKNMGVTEYLALKCNVKNHSETMLIKNKKLSVCPITTHIDVKDVSKNINSNKIINKLNVINLWYRKKYKKKPRIGVLGLNPHNAELRKNSEENKIIAPVIKKLSKKGYKIKGPLISDTLFIKNYKEFDVIVGMYHDQVLSPFKTLFKFDAINITLGLKYLRVSPDHGTAVNLIGKKKANIISLMSCIDYVKKNKR
tara:strand:+ start:11556 stop:12521 length:966 start_codon:yes stop_codon:yes gene_type:complete